MKNEGFVKVAKKSDIPLSHMKEVQVNGQSVCVANIDGKYFAINNICSHEVDPLPTENFKDLKWNVLGTNPNLI